MSYQAALALTLDLEGGLVLSRLPGDAGGKTYAGITEVMWIDTGNPPYSKGLPTLDQIGTWYNRYFWLPAHCADLPEPADAVMLQLAVNLGSPSRYFGLLQCAVGARPVDGQWGTKTLLASQRIGRDDFPYLLLTAQDVYYAFEADDLAYEKGLLGRTDKVRAWLKRLTA